MPIAQLQRVQVKHWLWLGSLALVVGLSSFADAQSTCDATCDQKPSCTSKPGPCSTCGAGCNDNCSCGKQPCRTPNGGGVPPNGNPAPNGAGIFAAPPRTGAVNSGSRSNRWTGPAITLPELTLRFPSIDFCGWSTVQRAPEMAIDSARAPLIGNAAFIGANGAPAGNGTPPTPNGNPAPNGSPSCTDKVMALEDRERQLIEQVERLSASIQRLQRLQEQQHSATPVIRDPATWERTAPAATAPRLPPLPVPTPEVRRVPVDPQPSVSMSAYDPYPVRPSSYAEEFRPVGPVRPVGRPVEQRPYLERLPPVE